MDNRFNPIKNLIDGEGRFIGTIHEKEEAINAIEDLARIQRYFPFHKGVHLSSCFLFIL